MSKLKNRFRFKPNIMDALFKKCWSVRELARQAGTSDCAAYRALEGKFLNLTTVGKIAAALEINALDYLEDKLKDS